MDIRKVEATQAQGPSAVAAAPSNGEFSEALRQATAPETATMDEIFQSAAKKFNVPLNLLKAVAKAESNFRPDAKSSCGAMGVMQLMPATAKAMGVADPYNAEQNIMGGAELLGSLLGHYKGDTSLALAAYNAGTGSVKKHGGVPPKTRGYVNKILSLAGQPCAVPNQTLPVAKPKRTTVAAAPVATPLVAQTVKKPAATVGDSSWSSTAATASDSSWATADIAPADTLAAIPFGLGPVLNELLAKQDSTSPQEANQIFSVLRTVAAMQMNEAFSKLDLLDGEEEDSTKSFASKMRFLPL